MGTPNIANGLSALVKHGGEGMDEKVWLEIIECRRQIIKHYARSFTLEQLDEYGCLRGLRGIKRPSIGVCMHGIKDDIPHDEDDMPAKSFQFRGIFFCDVPQGNIIHPCYLDYSSAVKCDSHTYMRYIFGLDRDGKWVIAEIKYRKEVLKWKEFNNPILYERAVDVLVTYPDGPDYIAQLIYSDFGLKEIADHLALVIYGWDRQCESRAKTFKEVADAVKVEDRIIHMNIKSGLQ